MPNGNGESPVFPSSLSTTPEESGDFSDTSPALPVVRDVLSSSLSPALGLQPPFLQSEPGEPEPARVGDVPVSAILTHSTTPEQIMQGKSEQVERPVDRINVRLVLAETEQIDEQLPIDVVRMLLSPVVNDCFIRISNGVKKPPRCKAHYLHTAYIREIMLLDELPAEGV